MAFSITLCFLWDGDVFYGSDGFLVKKNKVGFKYILVRISIKYQSIDQNKLEVYSANKLERNFQSNKYLIFNDVLYKKFPVYNHRNLSV